MSREPATVTDLLVRYHQGDKEALEKLFPLIYDQLHAMAKARMRNERPNHTLQPTALVNEAFLKLIDVKQVNWESRNHFFAMAATVMRRILVDHARARDAEKRGNGQVTVLFDEKVHGLLPSEPDLLIFDSLLEELAKVNERQSKVVELRYFAGLTLEEIAVTLDCSKDTIKRDWKKARLWLYHAIKKSESTE